VTDRGHDEEHHDGEQAEAVRTLVGEQLRAARAEVFRAYLKSREQARGLVEEERDEAGRQGPSAP
jgi:hypothetical protein